MQNLYVVEFLEQKMSFENEQYVSSRMDRIEALEQEITRLKQQLEKAREILITSLGFNGIEAQIEAEEKAKAWLEANK